MKAPSKNSRIPAIFTVDVEDWYHILDVPAAPPLENWAKLPARVEGNFLKLLDLFDEQNVRVTCFFLGWVAEQFPHLVREAAKRGHEIASHGRAHRLAFQMTPSEFRADAEQSRKTLEDLSGSRVEGYRAAGFSGTKDSPWFFEELARAGYRYDSSIFPGKRGHGGLPEAPLHPYVVLTNAGDLVEFPITLAECMGRRMCFFGGGYLRLFPYSLIRKMACQVTTSGRPVIFYVHPREIDPAHPRLKMKISRRFKSYVNLSSTLGKIERILFDFACTTFREHLQRMGLPPVAVAADFSVKPDFRMDDGRPAQPFADSPATTVKRSSQNAIG